MIETLGSTLHIPILVKLTTHFNLIRPSNLWFSMNSPTPTKKKQRKLKQNNMELVWNKTSLNNIIVHSPWIFQIVLNRTYDLLRLSRGRKLEHWFKMDQVDGLVHSKTNIILQNIHQNSCLLEHLGQIHPLNTHPHCIPFRPIFSSLAKTHIFLPC